MSNKKWKSPKPLIPPVNGHDFRTEEEIASDKQAQDRQQDYFARGDAAAPPAPVVCVRQDCSQPLWMGKMCREHYTRAMGWSDESIAALIAREEAKKR